MGNICYRFFPGDYMRDTADLSLVEDGAYRRMLDHYYSEESLPSDPQRLFRICRAFTEEEREAVLFVAKKYFTNGGDRLVNGRAEREIEERRTYLANQTRKSRMAVVAKKKPRGDTPEKPTGEPTDQPTDQPTGEPTGEPTGTPGGEPTGTPGGEPAGQPSLCLMPLPLSLPSSVPDPKDQKLVVPRAKPARFTPPTIEQVAEYCKARGNQVDPVKFHASYTSIGWMRGKNKIVNWKACVVTWERNEFPDKRHA